MKLLVINGPNLNLTGIRKPEIYGTETLEEINRDLNVYAESRGAALTFFQSNHEGAIIDEIQNAGGRFDGALINAGAYTHYSWAIRDAIEAVQDFLPFVEVHLSDLTAREEFRRRSVLTEVCAGRFSGEGRDSYKKGIDLLLEIL